MTEPEIRPPAEEPTPASPDSEATAPAAEAPAGAPPADKAAEPAADEEAAPEPEPGPGPAARRRRRNLVAAALIGVLTLLLGFAFAVQVRSTDTQQALSGAREEDLVGILDQLNVQDERLRQQIAEEQAALDQLTSSDTQSATALQEARKRAEAIGILNGTVAAHGPGITITIRDPQGQVRVSDLLDAIEELRGAGAETMQINKVRVGVSSAVTGDPGTLRLDGQPLRAPYTIVVIGSPPDLQTAMNIPGGVVQRISGRGGSVDIAQAQDVVVDALRPLDVPQYASPKSGGK
jgi:uncharacterized protein YlxW (UPF0749 family)